MASEHNRGTTGPYVVLGTHGNCLDLVEVGLLLAEAGGDLRPVGFLDDDPARRGTSLHGLPVLGDLPHAAALPEVRLVNGIGSTRSFPDKAAVIARTGRPWSDFLTLVHPAAQVSRWASLGPGTALLAQVSVGADVRLGAHVFVLQGVVLGHDTVVEDLAIVAGGALLAGRVHVGRGAYIGQGATVREGIHIGAGALVGAGAVVVDDVPAGVVVVGNPARVLRMVRSPGT